MKKLIKTIFILLSICILLLPTHNTYAFEPINNEVVASNKVWNIQFNKELRFDDELQKSIVIVDNSGNPVPTKLQLGKDMKSILINPPTKGYVLGGLYTLKIDTDIHSNDDIKLQKPIQMNFKINNNVLVENNENIKVLFNDNCTSLDNSAWSKSSGYVQKSFVADYNDNEKYSTHTPYGQYLFYNTIPKSISKITKNVEIGAGPFNIEFDAKIEDLQTQANDKNWTGFGLDVVANKKRYRLSFNSKDSDNNIKIHLLNNASGSGSYQTVNVSLPKDNNIHRWSIKYDGDNAISVLLDGSNIASFYNPQLASGDIKDMVVLYSDMNDVATGINKVYIDNFAVVKSLSMKDLAIIPDEAKQNISASVSINADDEKLIKDNLYLIKCSLYKNNKIVAEDTAKLDSKTISFALNNITHSGEMELVVRIISVDKTVAEISKIIKFNISKVNIEQGQTISSQPGKVYLYSQIDKLTSNTQNDAAHSGWVLHPYKDYESNKNGTIIENGANAQPLRVPINLNGWFRVYVGYVSDTESFKIAETNSASPLQINGDISMESKESYGDQWIYEKSTIISNFNDSSIEIFPNGSKKARIAYIKLVGLTEEQISLYGKQDEKKRTVLYDFDGYTDFFNGAYPDIDSLKSKTVDALSTKNVGELNWCVGTTGMLTYNSKYAGMAFEGVEEFDDQLRDGDVLAKYQISNILSSGNSPLEVVADRGYEKGMKVNASFRMDTFYLPTIYGFLNGAMYKDYNQYAQSTSPSLNYLYPEVREYIKNVLIEAASIDNVGGITLDFCRYPTVFGPETSKEETVLIMNEFLRNLRSEMPPNKTISIRVPYSNPLQYGFDINTWVKEGLLDRLIPSSIGNEEFFNVNPYVDMVKNTNVQLYIGITSNISGHDLTKQEEALIKQGLYVHNNEYLDVQQYLLRAFESYESGANGIFLFNTMPKLYIQNGAPVESTFLGEKAQVQKWYEFDYVSSFMVNKINIPNPTF
ncbi:hypothetical protein LGK97_01400 [Clostridium sp. CS001]|uniref:hypothetical protein n=1 Tax=Clostridium sp. CS001 TaxID=2880648 RepID=UPI001CF27877|nr:hypothetical protein [Clostridium sp. CS001]MCB2288422.1 hypothetical protein [Clostridium sp. CS001]